MMKLTTNDENRRRNHERNQRKTNTIAPQKKKNEPSPIFMGAVAKHRELGFAVNRGKIRILIWGTKCKKKYLIYFRGAKV